MHVWLHSIEKVSTSVSPRMGPAHEIWLANSDEFNIILIDLIGWFGIDLRLFTRTCAIFLFFFPIKCQPASDLGLEQLKNVFTPQWTMWCIFSVMDTDPTSLKTWYLFPVMETNYSTPLITVCSETSITQKKLPCQWKMCEISTEQKHLPNSLKNMVLIFRYGNRSEFSEQCGTLIQLWRHIPLKWTMWYFFLLLRHITQPL